MSKLRQLISSLSFNLARMILTLSCVLGIIVSVVFFAINFYQTQKEMHQELKEIISVSEGSAAYAAWTLDTDFAAQVSSSVMSHRYVSFFELRDDNGAVLSSGKHADADASSTAKWVASFFDEQRFKIQQKLVMPYDEADIVGQLSIHISPLLAAKSIISTSLIMLAFAVSQAIVVALLFLWIALKKITHPVKLYANFIDQIDLNNPTPQRLVPLPYQRDNEFSRVIDKTNHLLDELSTSQRQLRELASLDTLTNLPNRSYIVHFLNQALNQASLNKTCVAVLFLDLNRFKNINDSLGHDIGDRLLVDVAQRLKNSLCSKGTLGRLGGDEFLIVIKDIEQQSEVLYNLDSLETAFFEPFSVDGRQLSTDCSIGVAMYPEHGESASTLMRCADLAMYAVKPEKRTWNFYTSEMTLEIDARMKTENALNLALANNNFMLYYQPKVTALTSKLVGCEALIRWKKGPEAISAADFINVAEESGMIVELGYWVLQEACSQAFKWQQAFGDVPIAVNVSAKQLFEPDFLYKAVDIIRNSKVKPENLELEITETAMMGNLEGTITALKVFREMGIRISIDDFGTGYSSLAYLTMLPIDALKLDREFVSGKQQSKDVLKMTLSMAQSLNLITVAEGVETKEQQEWLVEHRCDYLQGYLFSKPIPSGEFEDIFLASNDHV